MSRACCRQPGRGREGVAELRGVADVGGRGRRGNPPARHRSRATLDCDAPETGMPNVPTERRKRTDGTLGMPQMLIVRQLVRRGAHGTLSMTEWWCIAVRTGEEGRSGLRGLCDAGSASQRRSCPPSNRAQLPINKCCADCMRRPCRSPQTSRRRPDLGARHGRLRWSAQHLVGVWQAGMTAIATVVASRARRARRRGDGRYARPIGTSSPSSSAIFSAGLSHPSV